jgi:hypothetical protein
MTKIIWNGCDSYVEADQAAARGHDFDGELLYTQSEVFTAFEATEINPEDLPKDEDGDPDFDGVLGTETGKFYRAA